MIKVPASILRAVIAAFLISGSLTLLSQNDVMGSSNTPPLPPPQFPMPPPSQPELSATQRSASTNQTCRLTPSLIGVESTPQQIEGPYFVDEMPNRSDIRSDTSNGSVQEGIPLRLILHVYDVNEIDGDGTGSCTPLKDAKVDVWHSNSQGVYSGVRDDGTAGNDFLRGYQMTDNNGTVGFTTVYPGWYEGRAIHIHVKVRNYEGSTETLEWTSQFYLNNSINELVHNQPPYSNHGPVPMTNEEDFIYTGPSTDGLVQTNTGRQLLLNPTGEDQGYAATFNIGLNASQSEQ
jgi:protocatechuate 3,4-dioxygenase beta subunit